jgi:hypothetical protein
MGSNQYPYRQLVTLHSLWQLDALSLLRPQVLLEDEEGVSGEDDEIGSYSHPRDPGNRV